jgi:hypothetical protein
MKSMRSQVEALRKDPKRKLSVSDIKREGYMPWATHHRTIVGVIRADMTGPNLLKAKEEGEGKQRRYTIEARNLINYLTAYGPVLMSMVRKPKTQNDNGAVKRRRN